MIDPDDIGAYEDHWKEDQIERKRARIDRWTIVHMIHLSDNIQEICNLCDVLITLHI